MKIVLAGKFEIALVRSADQIRQPDRNASTHEYYAGLNRMVPKSYSDRCGTFIALSEKTLVPIIDWGDPQSGEVGELDLGVEIAKASSREWDENVRKFVAIILRSEALSASSTAYISVLSISHYDEKSQAHIKSKWAEYSESVAIHYLMRLFLQLSTARETGSFVVVAEEDIQIIREIGEFVIKHQLPAPVDIPDLTGMLIEPETFCDGLLNFSPPDIYSVAAVRSDATIREYGNKVSSLLGSPPSIAREQDLLSAMVEAYEKGERRTRADKAFEVATWLVKPLHYVPVISEVLSVVEDAKDVGLKWMNRKVLTDEWHLVGVRMTDIAIKDYLNRKANRIRGRAE